jgi:peptidoglycan-associated lipoprotein
MSIPARKWRRLGLLVLVAGLIFGQLGCASLRPRERWWQFWRPKKAPPAATYSVPDPIGFDDGDYASEKIDPQGLPDMLPLGDPGFSDSTQYVQLEPVRAPGAEAPQLQTVYFGFDRFDLTPEARATLDRNAEWILRNPGVQIQIEGHTDERGTNEYNLLLGERRANSVKAYLISRGAPEAMLFVTSYGEERPVDPGRTEEAYALNRRAQFLVY